MSLPGFCAYRRILPILILSAQVAVAIVAARSIAEPPSEIAKKVMPSVVLITTEDSHGEALASGSGFVVADGIIATNLHLIHGAAKASVKVVNGENQIEVLGIVAEEVDWDLVLLAVKDLKAAPLPLGDSDTLEVGQDIYAVGNPQGLEGTFSSGVVSSIRKVGNDALLQISAPISPGSTGGPIVNNKGEVVGIAVGSLREGQNLNFAIASTRLAGLLRRRSEGVPLPRPNEEPTDLDSHESPGSIDWKQVAAVMMNRADQGETEAMFALGLMYSQGEGVAKDVCEAAKWFRKAADLGHAEAMHNLGFAYANGWGVVQDDSEAMKWWRKAAELGHAEAMCFVGMGYASGRGVVQDDREAVKWVRNAADLGSATAMCCLALMYAEGRGVTKDDREAVKWFRKAADLGYAEAMYSLGVMYAEGKGVTKDDREAVKWFCSAADLGVGEAMFNLGVMYSKGEGVIQDDIEAYAWLSVASTLGVEKARAARDIVAERLTHEARFTAQARAKERFEKIESATKK